MLLYHVVDATRTDHGFADYHPVDAFADEAVKRYPSLKAEDVVEEVTDPCDWELGVYIPFTLIEKEFDSVKLPESGTVWRGNFYTCADGTSHPRWASWSPVNKLNFHLPECFGEIIFG